MKKEVSTPVLIGIVVCVVLLIGFIGYRLFASPGGGGGGSSPLEAAQLQTSKARKNARDGGN